MLSYSFFLEEKKTPHWIAVRISRSLVDMAVFVYCSNLQPLTDLRWNIKMHPVARRGTLRGFVCQLVGSVGSQGDEMPTLPLGCNGKQGASRKRCKGSKIKRKEVLALQSCLSRCCALPECSSIKRNACQSGTTRTLVHCTVRDTHIESHTSNEPYTNI